MKIFVTVGTTKFDSLIKYIDKNIKNENFQIEMQIADGYYKPINYKYFSFTSDIENLYLDSDVVITHAGAGSIYHLLELRKRIICNSKSYRSPFPASKKASNNSAQLG